jgi:hypothetical protein
VCGDESGRTSAPINPQAVETSREHSARTGISSGSRSAFMTALWLHSRLAIDKKAPAAVTPHMSERDRLESLSLAREHDRDTIMLERFDYMPHDSLLSYHLLLTR